MRLARKRSIRTFVPTLATVFSVAALLGVAGCQSGGTAVSSYNGAQFADAIQTSQKNFRVDIHDRDAPTYRQKKVKAATVPLPDAPTEPAQPATKTASLDPDAGTAQPTDVEAKPVSNPVPSSEGPTIVAALRSEPTTALPGVGDPFAQVAGERALPSARPDKVPSKREVNGADMPLLAQTSTAAHKRRAKYAHLIRKHAKAHGVPVKLAMAVVQIESMYRPNAVGSSGEIGLMQILPRTARFIGYKGPMKALHDPDTNIRYGMKYLGKAHRLGGGSTCGTILKYNAGHGAKKMNSVSREYCRRVSRILQET